MSISKNTNRKSVYSTKGNKHKWNDHHYHSSHYSNRDHGKS